MRRIVVLTLFVFVASVFAGMLAWHFKEGMKFIKEAKAKEEIFVLPGMVEVAKKYRLFLAKKKLNLGIYHLYQAGLLAEKNGIFDKAVMYYKKVVKNAKVRKHLVMKNIFGKVVFDKRLTVKSDSDYVERAKVKLEHLSGVGFLKQLKKLYRVAVKRYNVEKEMEITPQDEPVYAELAKKREKLLAREEKYAKKITDEVIGGIHDNSWKKFDMLIDFIDNSWKEKNASVAILYKQMKRIKKALKFIIADLIESGQIIDSSSYEAKMAALEKVILKMKLWLKK